MACRLCVFCMIAFSGKAFGDTVRCFVPDNTFKRQTLELIQDRALSYSDRISADVFADDVSISVVDGSPENLNFLAENKASVDAMTEAGGWIIVWGVTPDSLGAFEDLVGVSHDIQAGRKLHKSGPRALPQEISLSEPDPLLDRFIRKERFFVFPITLYFLSSTIPASYTLTPKTDANSDDQATVLFRVHNEGVLVKYSRGKGGILAVQLNTKGGKKKMTTPYASVFANLIKNMGHSFDGTSSKIAGMEDFEPVPGAVKVFWSGASFLNPVSRRATDLINNNQDEFVMESYYGGHCSASQFIKQYGGEDMLRDAKPDFVVLGVASGLRKDGLVRNQLGTRPDKCEEIYQRTDKIADIVKEGGGKVIVWCPWNYEGEMSCLYPDGYPRPDDFELHKKRCSYCVGMLEDFTDDERKQRWELSSGLYRAQAKRYESKLYAPAGEAWARAFETCPKLDLYNSGHDRHHANDYGEYLASCIFYAGFTGQSPTELPVAGVISGREIQKHPQPGDMEETIRFLQKTAHDIYQEYKKNNELDVDIHQHIKE